MEEQWFNKSIEEVKEELKVGTQGLSDEQVKEKREIYGLNELQVKKKKSLIVKFLEQFKDFMIIILIIAAVISGAVGYYQGEGITDSIIILIVVIVNAIIGVAQESKAEKSLEALQKLSSHVTKVIRNGKVAVIPSKELVPGDIVILDTGDYVPADLRIIESANLKAQEASLTGESVPVDKNTNVINDEKIGLGDRTNMLFSSSLITYGRGRGIVVATGMNTEVGKIAGMINEVEETETPLQQKLNKLGKTLGIVAIVICVIIFIIGLLYGKEPIEMFMTAVSLAVAAIPEGLAAVSTIVLAIGVQRMVKKHAIVKKLPAVETLGSTTVICSDKTGTLTQNKMTVKKVFYNNKLVDLDDIDIDNLGDELEKLTYISMFCNDTKVSDGKLTGDPTETALIDMGFKLDFQPPILEKYERVKELPFDSDRKLMTTVHLFPNKYMVYTKGGVDELLSRCNSYVINGNVNTDIDEYKKEIAKQNEEMAKNALRVLAMAYKELDHEPTDEEMKTIESDLTYVGMVGMIDPPREEVKDAVEKCKTAGIKTVMITGDHKITAIAIAKALGILENEDEAITGSELEEMSDEDLIKNVRKYSVYARVSPEHKVRIVKAWQTNGEIVAMTGDGVNDCIALKKADVSFAMGSGTEVAKEASDIVILDDNIVSISKAILYGRTIFKNIRKFIIFQLSVNVSAILLALIGPFIGVPSPITVVQMLWINMVMDTLAGLAFSYEVPRIEYMKEPPKKKEENILNKYMINEILSSGLYSLVLCIIFLKLPIVKSLFVDNNHFMTSFFCLFIFLATFNAFNARTHRLNIFAHLSENKIFLLIILFIIIVQISITYSGITIFQTTRINIKELLITIVLSFSIIPLDIIRKIITKKTKHNFGV